MLDAAPASWGDLAGKLFIAEWGDLTPPTDPKVTRVGYRVVQLNPATKEVTPFISNRGGLPGSEQNSLGTAIERPFSVRFGPDGAMYIVDYGQVKIDPSRIAQGREPYAYVQGTGIIWKVSRK
jgi:glucose/arabinose dehydrogenase